MKIILIGFMCSGKSRVGRMLAAKLGWPHHDTDTLIAQQAGMPIADIINQQGEAAFRAVEKKAVSQVAAMDQAVVSTGGGVPLDAENMRQLTPGSEIVWLKIKPETALKRAGDIKRRPLIDPANPLESIRRRMDERQTAYSAAQHTIESDSLSAEQVVDKIISLIPALKIS